MELESLSKEAILNASSFVENAPFVLEEGERYTDFYSMKCKSSQSQNCTNPGKSTQAQNY